MCPKSAPPRHGQGRNSLTEAIGARNGSVNPELDPESRLDAAKGPFSSIFFFKSEATLCRASLGQPSYFKTRFSTPLGRFPAQVLERKKARCDFRAILRDLMRLSCGNEGDACKMARDHDKTSGVQCFGMARRR